jgi:hypothetical protein
LNISFFLVSSMLARRQLAKFSPSLPSRFGSCSQLRKVGYIFICALISVLCIDKKGCNVVFNLSLVY